MSATRAANPDTPAKALAKLAAEFPQQVLHNPVLPLLLLEQPDWLAQLPKKAVLACVNEPNGPPVMRPALLLAAAAHPAPLVRLAAAAQPDLSAELLALLARDPDPHVRDLARHRHGPPPPATELPAAVAATLGLGLGLGAALAPGSTLPESLAGLGRALPQQAGHSWHRAAPGPPLTVVQLLLYFPAVWGGNFAITYWQKLRAWLGSQVSPADLPQLLASPVSLARQVAAAHSATPPGTLAQLATDANRAVRQMVAENPRTPALNLQKLANDKMLEVREAIAGNAAAPAVALAQLAASTFTAVVRAVAENAATPPAVLARLANDSDWAVQAIVARRLADPPDPPDLPDLPDRSTAAIKNDALGQRVAQLGCAAGRRALLQTLADHDPATRLLLQLAAPDYLTPAHCAALAASPYPAHRLSVAHLPEFRAQLRLDAHLLVRTVAGA